MRLKSLLTVALAVALATTVFTGSVAAYDDGDAVVVQSNEQSNSNAQIGIASAENVAEQNAEGDDDDDNGFPGSGGGGFPGGGTG